VEPPLFEVLTPLGVYVRTTDAYWKKIVTFKHPVMRGKEVLVQQALREPVEVRRSRQDASVYLYYGIEPPYYVCVVARHLNGDGFIITTYRTDTIKEGECIWTA